MAHRTYVPTHPFSFVLGENDPHNSWRKIADYAWGPPNGGYMKKFPTTAMHTPMWLWSNEYAHTQLQHGGNTMNDYHGSITSFSPSVNGMVKDAVNQCTEQTLNPGGCQMAAVRQAYSENMAELEARLIAGKQVPNDFPPTSHPFRVSWNTGGNVFVPPAKLYRSYGTYIAGHQ